jgi:hypothetical protein
MRHTPKSTIAAAALLALAACGSEPEEQAIEDAAPAEDVAEDAVRLNGEGLSAGGERFFFNAGRDEVETALEKVLGEPARSATNTECDEGPINFVDYDGGLTLHFTDGSLVGWNWHLPYEGDGPISEDVAVAGDMTLGVPRAAVEGREGFELLEDSTLGEEFRFGDGVGEVGGFIEDDEVAALFAGTQCFIRGNAASE